MAGVTCGCFAQQTNSALSAGVDAGIPVGSEPFSRVSDVWTKIELPTDAESVKITLTPGFEEYKLNSNSGLSISNFDCITTAIGFKYYIMPTFFFEGIVGASVNTNPNTGTPGTELYYAPAVGLAVPLAKQHAIEIRLKYDARAFTNSALKEIGLGAAYKFGW